MNIPYLINPNTSVTVMLTGKVLTARADHPKFKEILDMLSSDSSDVSSLESLFDLVKTVADYVGNSGLVVKHGAVTFNGQSLANYTTDKIFQFMDAGLPVLPIVRFVERLMANPSKRAVDELYKFLEHRNMPLTENGFFRAYKGVGPNYMDKHTGKFSNHVGAVLKMVRNAVDDDANVGCSTGFHAGSLEYANNWAGADGHLMVVEIDPADVVSVPLDCNCQKLRTAKYVVVDELKDRKALPDTYIPEPTEDDDDEWTPNDDVYPMSETCSNCSGEADITSEHYCGCICLDCGEHPNDCNCDDPDWSKE